MPRNQKVLTLVGVLIVLLLASLANAEHLPVDGTGKGEAVGIVDSLGKKVLGQAPVIVDSFGNKVLGESPALAESEPTPVSQPTLTSPDLKPEPTPSSAEPKPESNPDTSNKIIDYYAGEIELEHKSMHTKIHYELRRNSLDLQFEGDYQKLKEKFIIQFRKNDIDENRMTGSQFDECPSLAYWFRKDLPGHVAFSLPAACRKGEQAVTPVFSLAGDWIREEDGIVRSETDAIQLWRFRGVR